MRRIYRNTWGGAAAVSGWVLWALDQFGRAQTVYDLIPYIGSVKINWAPIYLFVAIVSTGSLVAVNWDLLSAWRKRREATNQHNWDISLSDAAAYVAFGTFFGEALEEVDDETRLVRSLDAVWEAAKSGKLVLGASVPKSGVAEPLNQRTVRSLKLLFKLVGGRRYGNLHLYNLELVRPENEKMIVYDKLYAERRVLRRLWPAAPDRF